MQNKLSNFKLKASKEKGRQSHILDSGIKDTQQKQ